MKNFLITGGSGFFGSLLKRHLLNLGNRCVNIDLVPDRDIHKNLLSIAGDIRDQTLLDLVFRYHGPFDAVFHCAAQLAHNVKDKNFLWESNVLGTDNVAKKCVEYGVDKLVFISSNCLWGEPFGRKVLETDRPKPVEIYGRSKWEGEKILFNYKNRLHSVIFRTPTIIAAGRLGLLSILFEFMDENRKIWVIGGGRNRYQFIYADDLINASLHALNIHKTDIYNIGSDHVKSFAEIYRYVIKKGESGSRLVSVPKSPTIFLMKTAHRLGISPLGPYQYKMIAEDFIFDTAKIKRELNWRPTKTNDDMLLEAYQYYSDNKKQNRSLTNVSAHNKPAKMGVIRLLKWLS